jgi:hypothetical protein
MEFRDDQLQKTSKPLYGFGNKKVENLGTIEMNVSLGTGALMRTEIVTFDVVDIPYAYKAIFGRGIINKFATVIHMPFLCMKILTANGILTIYGNHEDAHDREYNVGSNQKPVHIVENSEDTLQSEEEEEPEQLEIKKKLCQDEKKRMQPHEHMKKVRLCEDVHEKTITIARGMTEEEEKALITCLRNNQDVFAWSKGDLRGVPREVIEHALRLDPKIPPKRQKLRVISPQKELAAQGEVDKLLDASVIREIQFTTWLSNIVMVPKKNGGQRMCIDFTLLNKAFPKDDYPLPRINMLVDRATGCEGMSLLDFFSGYHQVWMKKEDEDKTIFITPFGVYCFIRMPEGLRNQGPTFNKMAKIVLSSQLRRKISAYVDDVVIHSKKKDQHIEDLRETFANLRKYGLMLNPEKCIFGGIQREALRLYGVKVWHRSKSREDRGDTKHENTTNKKSHSEIYEKNSSTGMLHSAFSRAKPAILQVVVREEQNSLGSEEREAFEQFKLYLENLAILTSPRDKEKLLLYIAASASAVSAALVEEKYDVGQLKEVPVHFVSEALLGAKKFYSELEKMTCTVVMAARKLKPYFQSYSITVLTSYPLREILENKESLARIGKWATELSQYAIEFIARTAIKSQVLADFIADWTPSQGDTMNEDRPETPWVIHCDGAYCNDEAASSAILMSPLGIKMRYAVRLDFKGKTNNMAEYEGLLLGFAKREQ